MPTYEVIMASALMQDVAIQMMHAIAPFVAAIVPGAIFLWATTHLLTVSKEEWR